ncbi:glucan biosynthesis protein [Enterobacter hormaechei]
MGASYFRAVDDTYQYGLSARGLAVDTFTDTPEDPDFTSFWFEPLSRVIPPLPSMRCWTARALPVPISL